MLRLTAKTKPLTQKASVFHIGLVEISREIPLWDFSHIFSLDFPHWLVCED